MLALIYLTRNMKSTKNHWICETHYKDTSSINDRCQEISKYKNIIESFIITHENYHPRFFIWFMAKRRIIKLKTKLSVFYAPDEYL